MSKHTPGPWSVERDRAKSLSLYAGTTFIGEVYHDKDEPSTEEQGNVNLIAAAPGLKNALEDSDALLAELYQYVSTDLQACIVEQRRRNNDLLDAIEGVSA